MAHVAIQKVDDEGTFVALAASISDDQYGQARSEQQAVVERFLAALRTGRVQDLMNVLAPDVVLTADGGGHTAAAPAPIHGAGLVAEMLARPGRVVSTVWLNGAPAGRIELDGHLAAVSLVVENERISRIYAIANPQKLTRLDEPAAIAR